MRARADRGSSHCRREGPIQSRGSRRSRKRAMARREAKTRWDPASRHTRPTPVSGTTKLRWKLMPPRRCDAGTHTRRDGARRTADFVGRCLMCVEPTAARTFASSARRTSVATARPDLIRPSLAISDGGGHGFGALPTVRRRGDAITMPRLIENARRGWRRTPRPPTRPRPDDRFGAGRNRSGRSREGTEQPKRLDSSEVWSRVMRRYRGNIEVGALRTAQRPSAARRWRRRCTRGEGLGCAGTVFTFSPERPADTASMQFDGEELPR